MAVIREALEEVTNSEPFLPIPESVLPALLALRNTHKTIVESRAFLAQREPELEKERRQLLAAKHELKEQHLISDRLAMRIESLEADLASQVAISPDEAVKARLAELESKKEKYGSDTTQLMKSANRFIGGTLATMLAVEELGGPVVGDALDMTPEDLAAGFTAQGKVKRSIGGEVNADKGQRRIDEIWGRAASNGEGHSQDEPLAAGSEMKQLLEDLLNALSESKGDNTASYVGLTRESASARFLVRSQIAQFHPKDASRLKLIDFGREIDD